MSISVEEIVNKEFKTKLHGYDQVEVDDFLDKICDELDALTKENAQLRQYAAVPTKQMVVSDSKQAEKIAALEEENATLLQQLEAARAATKVITVEEPAAKAVKEDTSSSSSKTIEKMLKNVEAACDKTLEDAKSEAAKIVADANEKAEETLSGLSAEKASLQEEIEKLRAAASSYKERFQNLLKEQQKLFEQSLGLDD